jgi:hypothetical protein
MDFDPRDYDSRPDERFEPNAALALVVHPGTMIAMTTGGNPRFGSTTATMTRGISEAGPVRTTDTMIRATVGATATKRDGPTATVTRVIETAAWIRATYSCVISICRVAPSGTSCTTPASVPIPFEARKRARWQPSARFVWCPRATFETTTADPPIPAPATCVT